MANFADEMKSYKKQITNAGNQNFDKIAGELLEAVCQNTLAEIKDEIKRYIRQNPHKKLVSLTMRIGSVLDASVMIDGNVERDGREYVVRRGGVPYGFGKVVWDKRKSRGDLPTSTLQLKDLYVLQQTGGFINKRYTLTLTPLGQRYTKRLSDLCWAEGIYVAFDSQFNMFFKGNTINEVVPVGTAFSPRAFSLEEAERSTCLRMLVSMAV